MMKTRFFNFLAIIILFGFFSYACSPDSEAQTETDTASYNVSPQVLIFGGGDHHDFDRWFNEEDSTIIAGTGADVRYTDDPSEVLPALSEIDILNMNTNQSIDISEFPDRIIEFVEQGNGLLLVHAASWFIWDWPEYYSKLIGGGTSSHGPFGEFEVYVEDTDHPLMQNVPERFTITDELYRFQRDEDAADMHVLAIGIEPDTGDEYPVAWTVEHGNGRVVITTLGHDGEAHQHEAYVALLENSIEWLSQ